LKAREIKMGAPCKARKLKSGVPNLHILAHHAHSLRPLLRCCKTLIAG